MRKATQRFYLTGLITVILLVMATPALLEAAEAYLDIDLTEVTIGETRGVEPTPWHLSIDNISGIHYVSILTLNHLNGIQRGSTLKLAIPTGDGGPATILWSKHFMSDFARGVEPSPFIIFRNYVIRYLRPHFAADGTPVVDGSFVTIPAFFEAGEYGEPTCMAELPGSEFDDGCPRLFVGTDLGFIFILVNSPLGGVALDGIVPISDDAILDLEPIPQHGYIALGVMINNVIYGFSSHIPDPGDPWDVLFSIFDQRVTPLTDFDVFDPKDMPLPLLDLQAGLILANGTGELGRFSIPADAGGVIIPKLNIETGSRNIRKIAAGSLLMLPADESTILYDPTFSEETGSSGCGVDITDPDPDYCYGLCADVDNNGLVNILDIVYLVNYKYKSGPEPYIMNLGNVDGIDPVNILDIVYLINYKYKSGSEPNCP